MNAEKCKFSMPSLTFFGHKLTGDGVSPSEEKIAAIQKARPPQSVSEVKSFLGLVHYTGRFIPDLATVSEPLQKLLRKNQEFVWKLEQRKAFEELKSLITSAKTMAYFRQGCKTRVVADASPYGLGAVLLQNQADGWRVISYASRCLTTLEKKYSQTEKEALGLVWACERFHMYLFGIRFELETDHKPLEFLFAAKSKPSARVERWVLRLQAYDKCVVYRPGKTNLADSLSRLNNGEDFGGREESDIVRHIVAVSKPVAVSQEELVTASKEDSEFVRLREHIRTGNWSNVSSITTEYLPVKEELCTLGDLVLRGHRLVIPEVLRKKVLELAHEGHQGIVKTKTRLRTKVWWPKIDRAVEKLCKSCHGCQVVSDGPVPEPMARVIPPSGPWQDCAADLLGPMPSGEYLFVIVDYYSRYFEVVVLKTVTSAVLKDRLRTIFARLGMPYSLKTDNGPQFVSSEFREYLRENNIQQRTSSPLWPQANGEIERQNRTLLKSLRVAKAEGLDWRQELTTFLMAYRSTPQTSTGASPFYLMFGREMKTKLPEIRPEKSVTNEGIRDRDWQYKLKQKVYADERRGAKDDTIEVGDSVLVQTQKTDKLSSRYEVKPATITKKVGSEVTIRRSDGSELRRHTSAVKRLFKDTDDLSAGNTETALGSDVTTESSENMEDKPEQMPASRPSRHVGLPSRFKDFVVPDMIKK